MYDYEGKQEADHNNKVERQTTFLSGIYTFVNVARISCWVKELSWESMLLCWTCIRSLEDCFRGFTSLRGRVTAFLGPHCIGDD
jgi:hypothetical protein